MLGTGEIHRRQVRRGRGDGGGQGAEEDVRRRVSQSAADGERGKESEKRPLVGVSH